MENIKDWNKREYICKCGLCITNGKKKSHINNSTCIELQKYNLNGEKVKGTDRISCRICSKIITICGLHTHTLYCCK